LATEFALLITIALLLFIFFLGLPVLFLQCRDYCIKFYIKKVSCQLRLRHEAKNLPDLRFLSNRAVEEQLCTAECGSTPRFEKSEEQAQANLGEAKGDMETPVTDIPPPILAKPKLPGLKTLQHLKLNVVCIKFIEGKCSFLLDHNNNNNHLLDLKCMYINKKGSSL
jgi:hypothetical protein